MKILEYQGIRVPNKILITDPNCVYRGQIVELYLEEPWTGSIEKVFKIKDTGDDWFWHEDIKVLKYFDYEDIKNLLSFI